MSFDIWQTEPGGSLTCETAEFRLVLERSGHGLRFLVFRKAGRPDGTPTLVASGIERTSREAMKKAVAMALRAGDAGLLKPSLDRSTAAASPA